MGDSWNLKGVSDAALLRRLAESVARSRRGEADLVALIAEVDARELFAREAKPSMFAYCREVLGLRENEAYLRIAVARASREHPIVLTMLSDGRLHLSGVAKLAPLLRGEGGRAILKRAAGMSQRQIQELVAELRPQPDVRTTIRRLPAPRVAGPRSADTTQLGTNRVESSVLKVGAEALPSSPEPGEDAPGSAGGEASTLILPRPPAERPGSIEPLARKRFKVQFTAGIELREKLERLQALMRTTVPDGDLATLVDLVVTEKLERLEARRFGKTKKPRKTLEKADPTPASRHIPAPVRRAVYARDGGRCAYVDKRGQRCTARDRLEFHHHGRPFGKGGDHSPKNVRLMCRVHNRLMAEEDYGKEKMGQYRRRRRAEGRVSEAAAPYG
jgi:hypothetical protein